MQFPPTFITARPPRHRRRREVATSPPPPAALTLVSAGYAEGQWVEMTFDRAIDISAIEVTAISVDDGLVYGMILRGTGSATLTNPTTVRVPVSELAPSGSVSITLTASAATGIVAEDDGGTWAGVSELPLPFNG